MPLPSLEDLADGMEDRVKECYLAAARFLAACDDVSKYRGKVAGLEDLVLAGSVADRSAELAIERERLQSALSRRIEAFKAIRHACRPSSATGQGEGS